MNTTAAQKVLAENPFLSLLGIEVEKITNGEAVCRLRAEEKHTRIGGFLHGGATASLIDTAMAFAVGSIFGNVTEAVTVDLTIHYLRPIRAGETIAKARVVRSGQRLLTVSADVFDAGGKLSATAISTYSRIETRK
jgi:acyl-CoA thioesterase